MVRTPKNTIHYRVLFMPTSRASRRLHRRLAQLRATPFLIQFRSNSNPKSRFNRELGAGVGLEGDGAGGGSGQGGGWPEWHLRVLAPVWKKCKWARVLSFRLAAEEKKGAGLGGNCATWMANRSRPAHLIQSNAFERLIRSTISHHLLVHPTPPFDSIRVTPLFKPSRHLFRVFFCVSVLAAEYFVIRFRFWLYWFEWEFQFSLIGKRRVSRLWGKGDRVSIGFRSDLTGFRGGRVSFFFILNSFDGAFNDVRPIT